MRLRQRPDLGAYELGVRAWAFARNAVATTARPDRQAALGAAREALHIDPRSTLAIKAIALVHFAEV